MTVFLVLTILTIFYRIDRSWPFLTFFLNRFWPYRHGLMVLTPPMVFVQTDGIVAIGNPWSHMYKRTKCYPYAGFFWRRFTSPHLSCVICHVSCVSSPLSHVTYNYLNKWIIVLPSGEPSRWRVSYQGATPSSFYKSQLKLTIFPNHGNA